MLINTFFILLLFLTLFAIALWPVLFKNSAHKKAIFIGSNIIMLIMVIAFASSVYQTRQRCVIRNEKFRITLKEVAAGLRSGHAPDEPFISIELKESDRDNTAIFEKIEHFTGQAEIYGRKGKTEVQK